MHVVKDKSEIKQHNHSIICTRQEELGNEARFPKVITTVQCCYVYCQLNSKPRVVAAHMQYSMVLLSGGY